ncbi:MAG: TolC family protein [Cytophagaceae bacterium]
MKNKVYDIFLGFATIVLLAIPFSSVVFAQDNIVWTLDDCLDHALKNNYTVQQFIWQREKAGINYRMARNNYLPEVQGRVRDMNNWGLFVDPATNQLTNRNTEIYTASVEGEVQLFNGGYNYYNAKERQALFDASGSDLEIINNEISLLIISAYYRVLFSQEQVKISELQLEQAKKQYELVRGLVANGVLHKRDQLQMESEVAQREVVVTNANNNLLRSRLLLRQTMGFTVDENVEVSPEQMPGIPDSLSLKSFEDLCKNASVILPDISSAEARLNAANFRYKAARAMLYPTLSLSAGVITRSSSLLQIEQRTQFRQNLSQFIAFNLYVPVFTRFDRINNTNLSRIDVRIQENQVKKTNLEIEQRVQSAYLDLVAAHKTFKAVTKKLESLDSEYNYAVKSYNLGIINVTEYNYISNMFRNAQQEKLQAEYDYYVKKKILDFYEGKAICKR